MKTVEKLTEELREKISCAEAGSVNHLEVEPGGTLNGLDYGPAWIEVVKLDEWQVAFRYSDDAINEDWVLGCIEDAAEACYKKQVEFVSNELDDNDIEAWHRGELTANVARLVDRFGAFQIWGSRQGREPLTIVAGE